MQKAINRKCHEAPIRLPLIEVLLYFYANRKNNSHLKQLNNIRTIVRMDDNTIGFQDKNAKDITILKQSYLPKLKPS